MLDTVERAAKFSRFSATWVVFAFSLGWFACLLAASASARGLYADGAWTVLHHLLYPHQFNDARGFVYEHWRPDKHHRAQQDSGNRHDPDRLQDLWYVALWFTVLRIALQHLPIHFASRRFVLKTLLAFAGLSVALPASAYLDPGTGSVLLQSLIGIVAFAAAAVGTCFGRIRAFLFHRKKTSDVPGDSVERFGESHEK